MSVPDVRWMLPALNPAVILLTARLLCTGASHLMGPSEPVVALMGEDVLLPCQLTPPVNLVYGRVEWTKTSPDQVNVHFYEDRHMKYQEQHRSYRFHTRLFMDELSRGNVSLQIFRVKLSDEGKSRCSVPVMQVEASVHLIVGSVSPPVIQVVSEDSSRVELQCDSAGWYPEPEVLWLDGEGNLLPAGPTETLRGPDDLYTVSSRVTVDQRHSNNITCRVQQNNINQNSEGTMYIQGDVKVNSARPAVSIIGIVIGIIISISLIIIIIIPIIIIIIISSALFVFRKWRHNKNKITNSQKPGADLKKDDGSNTNLIINTQPEMRHQQTAEQLEDGGTLNELKDKNPTHEKEQTQTCEAVRQNEKEIQRRMKTTRWYR